MANHDLVGVPVPIFHAAFEEDKDLLKKIKKIENLIELKKDMEDAEEALKTLETCLNEDHTALIAKYGLGGMFLPDYILSYVIVLYAKAFTSSTGRTHLKSELKKIFENEDNHKFVMMLRNNFYAHHALEANRHQIFCLPNKPQKGEVKLNPEGQKTKIVMAKSIEIDKIKTCVGKVKKYLSQMILELCNSVENSLTDKQKEVINLTPKNELLTNYWTESNDRRPDPFKIRTT